MSVSSGIYSLNSHSISESKMEPEIIVVEDRTKKSMKLKRRWIEQSKDEKPKETFCQKRARVANFHQQREHCEQKQQTVTPMTTLTPYQNFSDLSLFPNYSQLTVPQMITTPYIPYMNLEANYIPPYDPRSWTKLDVQFWLKQMALTHNLQIDTSRFSMNGKALCLMNMEMFIHRVPVGGKLLYKDFRIKLYRAVHFEDMLEKSLKQFSQSMGSVNMQQS